ncbi:hypothetical protein [Veillonella montpellierensis]|uniref:hypothetical protein n=1 Tax=Veillonella montpellierensis TaxID=187328 RepID=UPI0023F7311B|nr:hypothetical protein [Veillonella montpellierensis]
MNIKELQKLLPRIGIFKTSYNIEHDGSEVTSGGVVLESTPKGICVYYTERYVDYEIKYFKEEETAVKYFLYLLEGLSTDYKNYLKNKHFA